MTHIHKQTGKEFDVGRLIDSEGKSYDINVILKWDIEHDFDQAPVLIDYYFGDPESEYTDNFIDMFIENQNQLKKVVAYLEGRQAAVSKEHALTEMIKAVKSLITDLI